MTILQILNTCRNTDVICFKHKSWEYNQCVVYQFNNVIFEHFLIIDKDFNYLHSKFQPNIKDLLSDDFKLIELTMDQKLELNSRFFKYAYNNLNNKKQDCHIVKQFKENIKLKNFNKDSLFKGVSFHYSFGPQTKNIKNTFSFRATRSGKINGELKRIPYKDFELNDYGLINAAFYLDNYIRETDIGKQLHKEGKWKLIFSDEDYNFIKKYNARTWVKTTQFKSSFNYEKNCNRILLKYFKVEKYLEIKDSYPSFVIKSENMIHVEETDFKKFLNKYEFSFTPEYKKEGT